MKTTKKMMMKTMLISLFALLLPAAQAQGADRQPLAVLVVGVDNWMFGDVIAHIVGEELKRSNPNLVPVTREKFVQNKLKALRRTPGAINLCEFRAWASAQNLAQVCLVEAKKGIGGNANAPFSFANAEQKYSAQVIDVTGNRRSCVAVFDFTRSGGGEMAAAELTKVAWEVVGRLQSSSCESSSDISCHPGAPEMVLVEKGTFTMGCDGTRDGGKAGVSSGDNGVCISSEEPQHSVTLTKDFYIGVTEITQGEWYAVMGSFPETIPKSYLGDDKPMIYVSWNDITGAGGYLEKLNAAVGLTESAHKYRLPTEAEWEYAARGGHHKENFKYSGHKTVGLVACYKGNVSTLQAVKTKAANALGVYDMSGNVWEWCSDRYGSRYYSSTPQNDPTGPTSGNDYVVRSGSWYWEATECRIANRNMHGSGYRDYDVGFRVVFQ
ncbi:MAG: formylglycine-generating enzyme family protein [Prevotellaceae bacterium]|nr:formylglycine-generating enzyme family protein [Prevotellaceae bacterium]